MAAALSHSVRTHCPYCALQCGLVARTSPALSVVGDREFPVNAGAVCIKGWNAAAVVQHPERLTSPLERDRSGSFTPVGWRYALDRIAGAIATTRERYGAGAVGILGGGALTNEKAYLLGKFARVAVGTPHVDYNGRYCMSSGAAASIRAFGLDRGLPFPLEDLAGADVILLVGSNPAETMPPFVRYLDTQQRAGGTLIVIDPRESATAARASLHLRPMPGTDAALANGLLHVLLRDGLIDREYIRQRTEGFARVRALVAGYWPEHVERLTGVPEGDLVRAAHLLGTARTAFVLTGRGPEQQSRGVDNTLAFINVALALGLPGTPGCGFGILTGQGNGQGGREHGQKADQLPGYRSIADPEARRAVAEVWGVDPDAIPGPGRSAYELLSSCGRPGGIRTLFVMGFNPIVSSPDARTIAERLSSLDFLAVCDPFFSETARLADIVLPSAQWAEEEGTMTNLEGRVIRRRRAVAPPPGVATDVGILTRLAERLGHGDRFTYADPEEVFRELARATRGAPADYSGITYAKIDASDGVFWPCPDEAHPGTPRLFLDRFPTPNGRARFHPVRHRAPAEMPDRDYPLFLTTGRVLAHYQSGTMTRRVDALNAVNDRAVAELHPRTAARFGVRDGDSCIVRTRRGCAQVTARVTRAIRPDTLFLPFHWSGAQSANRLTSPALDPVSRMPELKVCAARLERAADPLPPTGEAAAS
ncbi:MAG TPA: molybdopterin oxidoreductase family protein [Vicinamibacterales bacterium]